MYPGELIRYDKEDENDMSEESYSIHLHPDNEHGAFVPRCNNSGVGREGILRGVSREDADAYETSSLETRREIIAKYIRSTDLIAGGLEVVGGYVRLRTGGLWNESDGNVANKLSPGDVLVELSPLGE